MLEILSVYFELRNSKKDSNIFKTQSVYQKPSKNKAKIFQTKELPYCIPHREFGNILYDKRFQI